MNVSIRLTTVRAALIGLVALLLAGCGGEQDTAPSADAQAPSVPIPEPQTAYLMAAGGDVQSADGTVEAGDPLADGVRLNLGPDSFADIQFGNRAVARVWGQAIASVRMSGGPPENPILELVLDSGVAAINVAYLASGEVFRVRTPRVLYRVTGTRFTVSAGAGGAVAVSEGVVEVMPAALDIDGITASEAAEDEDVRDALFALENALPHVSAGQGARVDPAAMDRSSLLAVELAEKLRMVEAATAAERPSLVQELVDVIRATTDSLSNIVVSQTGASAELADKLAQIDALRLHPVPKDPQGLSLLESEEISNLVKFTIRTVPQNADIYINDLWVGQSVYEGILLASDSLSIRVSKEGYRERRIQVDRARSEVLTVQLERLPPSISAESFVKAIRADDLATVRTYVQEGGSVNVRTDDNIPAVVVASGLIPVLRGQAVDLSYHQEILRTVVAADADLEAPFVIEGSTFRLLHAAVLAGMAGFDVVDLVTLLIDAGANVDGVIALEGEELTPLAIAVRWALYTGEIQEDLLKLLVQSGASLDVAISYNDELLTLKEIAARLIEGGDLEDAELIRLLRLAGVPS